MAAVNRVAALWDEWAAEDSFGDPLGPLTGAVALSPVTFPTSFLTARVYIALGADLTASYLTWNWLDITDRVRHDLGITVTAGRGDYRERVNTSRCTIKLSNGDGYLSRRNPLSPYYGLLTKNTPIWIQLNPGSGYVDRYFGYVNEWPASWADASGNDSFVTIQCSGTMRRLEKGRALKSALYRTMLGGLENDIPAIAYWPMEDGANATQFASAIPGAAPLTVVAPATLSTNSDIPGSAPLPAFGVGAGASGPIPSHTDTGVWYAQAVGLTSDFSSYPGFTVVRVEVAGADHVAAVAAGPVSSGGFQLGYSVLSPDEYPITSGSSPLSIDPTGVPLSIVIGMKDNASGTDDYLYVRAMTGDGTVVGSIDVNLGPGEYGRGIVARPNGKAQLHDNGVIGHFAYYTDPAFTLGVHDVANARAVGGHAGEQAHERITRLCREENVSLVCQSTTSAAMGPQTIDNLLGLLRECEQADQGLLYEAQFGLGYLSLAERYNLTVSLALDFDAGHHAGLPEPRDDDQRLVNRFTASRRDGSSSTAEKADGTLGTGPGGSGVYEDSATVNVETDGQLADYAAWRVHLGTVDEDRWPTLPFQLHRNPSLIPSWLSTPLGGRVTAANPPQQMAPDPIDAIIEGYTEHWVQEAWNVSLFTSPASPYTVAEVDSNTRVVAEGSTLSGSLTSTDMSFSLESTVANGVWTTDPADFPLDVNVGGERVRLSAISGSSSPQTATVATGGRSINGVVKAHASGTPVDVWEPAVVAL